MTEMQDVRSLDPQWMPKPPPDYDSNEWRIRLRAAGVLLFAAAIVASIVVSIPSIRLLRLGTSFWGNAAEQLPKTRLNQQDDASAKAAGESENPKESKSPPEQLSGVATAHTVPVATTPTAPPIPGHTARDFVTRQLDPDEMASMRLHADHFIKSGDLSSARLLLERAAQAGDEDAALTLGGTFDPDVLKTLGLQDGFADIGVARLWYERAAKFGAAEARERLRRLAAAPAR
jgi:TPR repeat protein